jgi:hypothetical protein
MEVSSGTIWSLVRRRPTHCVCLIACVCEPQKWCGQGTGWAVAPHKENVLFATNELICHDDIHIKCCRPTLIVIKSIISYVLNNTNGLWIVYKVEGSGKSSCFGMKKSDKLESKPCYRHCRCKRIDKLSVIVKIYRLQFSGHVDK